jgi:hypothetical protein
MEKFFFKNDRLCHGHDHPGREFFDAHYLHHVLLVLLEKVFELVLVHRRDFAELQGQLKALLELKFLLSVLEDILVCHLCV